MKRSLLLIFAILSCLFGNAFAQEAYTKEQMRQLQDLLKAKKNLERPVMVIREAVVIKDLATLQKMWEAKEKSDMETLKNMVQVDKTVFTVPRGQSATYLDDSSQEGLVWIRLPGRSGRWLIEAEYLTLLK
jgi:hypothetical protein